MVDVSACGTSIPNAEANGLIKKLTAKPHTQIHAVAGRHPDWNQLPFASSLFTYICALAISWICLCDIVAISCASFCFKSLSAINLSRILLTGSISLSIILYRCFYYKSN